MIKYIILAIFLVMIIVTVYLWYANHINDTLNKKKEQIGAYVYKNKYKGYLRVSGIGCIVTFFSVLLSFNLKVVNNESPFVSFKNNNEYEEAVLSANKLKVSNNSITILNTKKAVNNTDALFIINEGKLIKYSKEEVISINVEVSDNCGILLYNNMAIVYSNYSNNSKINIYNQMNLECIESINVNYNILDIDIINNDLNIVTYGMLNKKLKVEFEKAKKTDLLEYFEASYLANSNNRQLLCHSKINLKSLDVKQFGLLLSDIYLSEKDDVYYLGTNVNSRIALNTSVIFTYDIQKMNITNSLGIGGFIYNNPVVNGEIIYIDIELKENNEYLNYELNNGLDIKEVKELVDSSFGDYLYTDEYLIYLSGEEIVRYDLDSMEKECVMLDINTNFATIKDFVYANDNLQMVINQGNKDIYLKYNFNNNLLEQVNSYNNLFITNDYLIEINGEKIINIKNIG